MRLHGSVEPAELSSALALPAGAKPNALGDWKQLETAPMAGRVEWKKETGEKNGVKERPQGKMEFLLPGQASVGSLLTVKGEAIGFPTAHLATGAMEKEEVWTFQDFEVAISAKGGQPEGGEMRYLGKQAGGNHWCGTSATGEKPALASD